MSQPASGAQTVHLLGICGTAMAALAGALQEMGHRVTGSDAQVYPPMSEQLAALGIPILEGYRAEHIPADVDLVVVGNVIRESNPEAEEMRRRGLPFISMAEAVHRFLIGDREPVVVVGTHGKTTTTALAAQTLHALDADPGMLVGGIARNFESNYRLGGGGIFVIEGDEYDTAYFDKTPKFFKYHPRVLIFTSLEFDHADIYSGLDVIREHFRKLIRGLPGEGTLIACSDDREVRGLLDAADCPVVSYGESDGADCRLEGWRAEGGEAVFETVWRERRESWRIPLPGRYNALNATAVMVMVRLRGYEPAQIQQALLGFQGVKRRQELRGEVAGIAVIDDFAHHPTAVGLTIEAMRHKYPGRRLWAVFEPRSFTARGNRFQEEFGTVFQEAHRVLLAPAFLQEYSQGMPRLDTEAVAGAIRSRGGWAVAADSTQDILERLLDETRTGDVVLIMSNGGFDNLHEQLLTGLEARGSQARPKH
ncbi:MAG: Mur ligase domain-containing protein [SAR324 cluster bacterium]|nr:Mur ligase domain-containing protein [SAR324 cluster bacterium]